MSEEYKIARPENADYALGLATRYLMADEAFAQQPFGGWARVLAGQIERGHYFFVLAGSEVAGFAGWSYADSAHAEEWLKGKRQLSFEDSQTGDAIIFNCWKARSADIQWAMVGELKRVAGDKITAYAKRYFNDGRAKLIRLPLRGLDGKTGVEKLEAALA